MYKVGLKRKHNFGSVPNLIGGAHFFLPLPPFSHAMLAPRKATLPSPTIKRSLKRRKDKPKLLMIWQRKGNHMVQSEHEIADEEKEDGSHHGAKAPEEDW